MHRKQNKVKLIGGFNNMLKKIMILISISLFIYVYGCGDKGEVKSIADLEKRVQEVNNMNTELEKQKTDLYGLVRQFNAKLPADQQFDITSMDTLIGAPERDLLRAMFKEEKDISYNGLLGAIIDKNKQIADLQEKIADLEKKMPIPYTVKKGDTHYQIVLNYLIASHQMTKKQAHEIAWKTALIDDILPGNRIWLMYENGMVGSFVTQGDAKISPMKVIRLAKKRMLEKAKITSSAMDGGINVVVN
jgi:LysM repeat protein